MLHLWTSRKSSGMHYNLSCEAEPNNCASEASNQTDDAGRHGQKDQKRIKNLSTMEGLVTSHIAVDFWRFFLRYPDMWTEVKRFLSLKQQYEFWRFPFKTRLRGEKAKWTSWTKSCHACLSRRFMGYCKSCRRKLCDTCSLAPVNPLDLPIWRRYGSVECKQCSVKTTIRIAHPSARPSKKRKAEKR